MLSIEKTTPITVNAFNTDIDGTVTGTTDGWTFECDNEVFLQYFPDGSITRKDIGAGSPYAHKEMADRITRQVERILNQVQ